MPAPPTTDIRDDILAATRHLLVREGFNSLTMRKIARVVGCSVGSIYLHFDGKDALLATILETAFEQLHAAASGAAAAPEPEARLRGILHAYVDFGLANPEYYEIMFMMHPKEMSRFPDAVYARALAVFAIVEDAIAAYTGTAGDAVRPMAVTFWATAHGLVSLMLAGRLTRLNLPVDHATLIGQAVDQALLGLLAAAPGRSSD